MENKKNILTISGSSRPESTNKHLLRACSNTFTEYNFEYFEIGALPLFQAYLTSSDVPTSITTWKAKLKAADAVFISTPSYLHNIPAALKSALEWIADSGELVGKPVLPITYTPSSPRGEKTMKSLIWSLQALDTNIVTSLELHHADVVIENGVIVNDGGMVLLHGALELLFHSSS